MSENMAPHARAAESYFEEIQTMPGPRDGTRSLLVRVNNGEWVSLRCPVCNKHNEPDVEHFVHHTRTAHVHRKRFRDVYQVIEKCGFRLTQQERAALAAMTQDRSTRPIITTFNHAVETSVGRQGSNTSNVPADFVSGGPSSKSSIPLAILQQAASSTVHEPLQSAVPVSAYAHTESVPAMHKRIQQIQEAIGLGYKRKKTRHAVDDSASRNLGGRLDNPGAVIDLTSEQPCNLSARAARRVTAATGLADADLTEDDEGYAQNAPFGNAADAIMNIHRPSAGFTGNNRVYGHHGYRVMNATNTNHAQHRADAPLTRPATLPPLLQVVNALNHAQAPANESLTRPTTLPPPLQVVNAINAIAPQLLAPPPPAQARRIPEVCVIIGNGNCLLFAERSSISTCPDCPPTPVDSPTAKPTWVSLDCPRCGMHACTTLAQFVDHVRDTHGIRVCCEETAVDHYGCAEMSREEQRVLEGALLLEFGRVNVQWNP